MDYELATGAAGYDDGCHSQLDVKRVARDIV